MSLVAVNTGCRDGEICRLLWDWKFVVPQLGTPVFIIPDDHVKNGDDRLVVLNCIALSVVEQQQGIHPVHVFIDNGKPVTRMLNTAWLLARKTVGLPQVRTHDLKHTFVRQLRSARVSFEDRQDLLGHRSARITTQYSAAELSKLLEAANTVCNNDAYKRQAEIVVLRRRGVS